MTTEIQYRGAKISLNEFLDERAAELKQQGTRHIQYRGGEDDIEQIVAQPRQIEANYRGATGTVDV